MKAVEEAWANDEFYIFEACYEDPYMGPVDVSHGLIIRRVAEDVSGNQSVWERLGIFRIFGSLHEDKLTEEHSRDKSQPLGGNIFDVGDICEFWLV
jgi:hypothetical protein